MVWEGLSKGVIYELCGFVVRRGAHISHRGGSKSLMILFSFGYTFCLIFTVLVPITHGSGASVADMT